VFVPTCPENSCSMGTSGVVDRVASALIRWEVFARTILRGWRNPVGQLGLNRGLHPYTGEPNRESGKQGHIRFSLCAVGQHGDIYCVS
jgi:hypothetical protein